MGSYSSKSGLSILPRVIPSVSSRTSELDVFQPKDDMQKLEKDSLNSTSNCIKGYVRGPY
jgi:hypothetical protein